MRPYEPEFVAFVKRKWVGKAIIDVFSREFKALSKQCYIEAIETGRITVKGKIVVTCYKLKDGDKIVHKIGKRVDTHFDRFADSDLRE